MPTQVRIFAMPKSLGETLATTSASSIPRSLPDLPNGIANGKLAAPLPSSHKPTMPVTNEEPKSGGVTFAGQDSLPKLPIPELDQTCKKYLAALKPLQGSREHAETRQAVQEFLKQDGPGLQEKLQQYAAGKTSYIEQFCRSSCLLCH